MKGRTKNILLSLGALTAAVSAACTVSYKVTKTLVSTALDREMPKGLKHKKPSGRTKPLDAELCAELAEASENLKNTEHELVNITSYDGENLVGHWFSKPQSKRIIIAMHGWRSSWVKDFCGVSSFWFDNNCSVLYAEQRGQNESGGDYMGFGMIERYDCYEWIKWVNDHNDSGLPIYLAGISMGASTVLMASGLQLPQNIHGIMADCGFTSAKAIWKHVMRNNMHMSYSIRSKLIEDMCKKKLNITSEECTTLQALENNKIPVLFIHGTEDDFVPIEMTYDNYKACRAPKKLFVVPGASHGMSYVVDKDGYQEAVLEFWDDFD